MIRHLAVALVGLTSIAGPTAALAQARNRLSTTEGLRTLNTAVESVTFKGKPGVRVTVSPELGRRPEYLNFTLQPEQLVRIEGLEFSNGTIEAEIAGAPAEAAFTGARGFVGIAFRLREDRAKDSLQTYDAFYLRPTNGRVDDQERRNHTAQYISHPSWTWNRLRTETPSKYEAYVDITPDTWTPIRIEVDGTKARLYVNGQSQPTLIVNDVKSGPTATGAIALWIGPGTVGHFRNLVVTPKPRD